MLKCVMQLVSFNVSEPSLIPDLVVSACSLATSGISERSYLQVGFGFARGLWMGMADGRKHLPFILN